MDRPAALKALDLPLDASLETVRAVVASRRRRIVTRLEFARDRAASVALRADLARLARVERVAAVELPRRVDRMWIAVGVVGAGLLTAAIAYLTVSGSAERPAITRSGAPATMQRTEPAVQPATDAPTDAPTGAPTGAPTDAPTDRSLDRTTARRAAEQGHRDAMFHYGRALAKSVDPDPVSAASWYRRAARRGHPLAMNDLGWAYYTGFGVEREPARALDWFRRSAALGEPAAMNNLGVMLDQGHAVARDVETAATWFRRAAKEGNAAAMYHLGLAYETGVGVEPDAAQAETWYRRSAEAGDADARAWIAGYDAIGQPEK